jgi:hypothetical protein
MSNITYSLEDNSIEVYGFDLKDFDEELLVYFNRISEEDYKNLNEVCLEYILHIMDDYNYGISGIVSDQWVGVYLGYSYKTKPENSYDIKIHCYNINRACIVGLIILDKIKNNPIVIDNERRVLDLNS